MTRLAIALALFTVLGCSGTSKPPPTTTPGAGTPPPRAKKVSIGWGITPAGEMSDLFLALTDETGSVVSHPLGRWKGTCVVATPPASMNALTSVECRTGGTGTALYAAPHGGNEIVVLYGKIDEGVDPDPMAREEVKRIKVPLGAAIEAGS